MGGTTKFEDALAARLNLMQPSRSAVAAYLDAHPPSLSPGVPALVAALQARGAAVYLVSGGFRAVIDPIADSLNIPRAHVYANTLIFNDDGSYAGFDRAEPTSRSGGKAAAVKTIRAGFAGDGAAAPRVRLAPGDYVAVRVTEPALGSLPGVAIARTSVAEYARVHGR